jgi:hypothetical protein
MLRNKDKLTIAGLINLLLLSIPSLSLADSTQTIFYVATNGNTGRANYDIRLNSDCSPAPNNPVYVYWKKADGSTRELNSMEQQGYGISNQSVTGNKVSFTINAFQNYGINKPITVTSSRSSSGCQNQASTTINDVPTQLSHADVKVNRTQLMGVIVGLRILDITLVGANQQSETIACRSNCSYGI